MAKRFSGEVRLTVSLREGCTEEYDVRVRAPGCSLHEGVSALQSGYTALHGTEAAIDEAALMHLRFVEEISPNLVSKAAKHGKNFHVGREKANRWPGGPSNTKTKKGR